MKVMHISGIWDNMRLYGGASIGESAITHSSVSISYLFRMSGFPMVYAALTHIASEILEVSLIWGIEGFMQMKE